MKTVQMAGEEWLLLANQKEWARWTLNSGADEPGLPIEFPCWAAVCYDDEGYGFETYAYCDELERALSGLKEQL